MQHWKPKKTGLESAGLEIKRKITGWEKCRTGISGKLSGLETAGPVITGTSRPAIAGNPRCKNITAKSVHLTSLYHMALTSTNDHLSVLRHCVCT